MQGRTMKELIADSMMEVEDSKVKHKTLIDWSSLIKDSVSHGEKSQDLFQKFEN